MKSLIPKAQRLWPEMKSLDFDKQFDEMMDMMSLDRGERSYVTQEGHLVLHIDVPGFNRDNIHVNMVNGVLKVQGDRTIEMDGLENRRTVNKEYSVGTVEDIEATVKDGVLTIRLLPYKRVERREIEVK